uniref:Uncharacterized protein n=1 Tax=Anguilla anguilla TaxID=7936 RepID=A0A0E9XNC1_ANGAN
MNNPIRLFQPNTSAFQKNSNRNGFPTNQNCNLQDIQCEEMMASGTRGLSELAQEVLLRHFNGNIFVFIISHYSVLHMPQYTSCLPFCLPV